ANVVIEDDAFAEALRDSLLSAMKEGAAQVRRESWSDQPWPVRVVTWASYGLARLLTGLFAYGRAREFT
ncbi:MAG TPA: hypothetical protein VIA19_15855, partial [Burkholderiales bacterium]